MTYIAFENTLLPVSITRKDGWTILAILFPDERKTDDIYSVIRMNEADAWMDVAKLIHDFPNYIRNKLRKYEAMAC